MLMEHGGLDCILSGRHAVPDEPCDRLCCDWWHPDLHHQGASIMVRVELMIAPGTPSFASLAADRAHAPVAQVLDETGRPEAGCRAGVIPLLLVRGQANRTRAVRRERGRRAGIAAEMMTGLTPLISHCKEVFIPDAVAGCIGACDRSRTASVAWITTDEGGSL